MTFDKCLIYGTLMDTEGADYLILWDADGRGRRGWFFCFLGRG
jgi:hypothetical protein